MAKKASKAPKKIKKAKPAKSAAKSKKKPAKPSKLHANKAGKPAGKKKKAGSAKPKKAAKPIIKKTNPAPAQKVKAPIAKAKTMDIKIKAMKPIENASSKPAVQFSKERVPLPPELIKQKRAPRVAKVKKMKQEFIPFNPIQPVNATGKPVNTSKKEPKGKFELEYVIRCSQTLLYEFITSPSGLSEWFADDVNIRDGIYTFIWDGSQQQARLLALKEDAFVRYQWVDKTDGSYFEFRIQIDELTGDVSLMIVDFADSDEEKESSRLLWDAQVDKLMKTIGSHG